MCNAFVSYIANRYTGMRPEEAYAHIGLAYGDDGLRGGNISDDVIQKAAADLGFDLRVCNRAKKGKPVSFLSRVFADPWSSPASIQSPLRTLLKIHTSVDTVNDPGVVGWSKTTAYLVTDSLTPFVSNWCRAYQRNCVGEARITGIDVPYWVINDEDLAHPWPQSDSDVWLGIVASELQVSVAELTDHLAQLDQYDGPISGLPRLTTNVPLNPKLTVTLDGEVHAGPIVTTSENGPNTSNTQPTTRTDSNTVRPSRNRTQPTGGPVGKRTQRGGDSRHQQPRSRQQTSRASAAHSNSPRSERQPRGRDDRRANQQV